MGHILPPSPVGFPLPSWGPQWVVTLLPAWEGALCLFWGGGGLGGRGGVLPLPQEVVPRLESCVGGRPGMGHGTWMGGAGGGDEQGRGFRAGKVGRTRSLNLNELLIAPCLITGREQIAPVLQPVSDTE